MRTVAIVARYLLGLIFTVFGLNGFLNFIHQPPPPNPVAIQFLVSVSESHFAAFFFAIQVLGGLLLLSGYFTPLALTLLAAELYNILNHPNLGAPTTGITSSTFGQILTKTSNRTVTMALRLEF